MKIGGRDLLKSFSARRWMSRTPATIAEPDVNSDLGYGDGVYADARGSIIGVVELLIGRAHALRASDIHIDPHNDRVVVRERIDGVLEDVDSLPRAIHQELISRLKILSGLRIDEHYAPQDGRFGFAAGDMRIDVRLSIIPTYYGENAVLRLLAPTPDLYALSSLGFSAHNERLVRRALERPHGLILATGPTGSGKTSTMYSIVRELHRPGVSIVTLEDPIEYSIPGVRQIQINPATGFTFGKGLRSVLRQDPDIIMIGEIRDSETAGLAVNAALTGHLVLSTLHTNDAPSSIVRLIDMGVEPYLIASTVSIAIGQRLVRRLCDACKQEEEPDPWKRDTIARLSPGSDMSPMRTYRHGACSLCRMIGYAGRVGVHEAMSIDGAMRAAIMGRASIDDVRASAIKSGMTPLIHDALAKASEGHTSLEEVLRLRYE